MEPQDFTSYHRRLLDEDAAIARAEVEAATAYANELAGQLPPTGELSSDIKLWIKAGNFAAHACMWFAFIAPILLILHLWE